MLGLTTNSRATLADAAQACARVSQCREHARLPQHRATTPNVCAWDTRAKRRATRDPSPTCADPSLSNFPPFLTSCFWLVQIPSTTRKHLKGYETPGNFPELDAHFRHLLTGSAGNERQVFLGLVPNQSKSIRTVRNKMRNAQTTFDLV